MAAFDPTRCALCGSPHSEPLITLPRPAMSSDGRPLDVPLLKLACRQCGLIRTGIPFTEVFLDNHYGAEYRSGERLDVEPAITDGAGRRTYRSAQALDWIAAALGDFAPRRVLEVGCGPGFLLARFATLWQDASLQGVEPGQMAAERARALGLDVRCGGIEQATGPFDLIYSVAVVEHVPSPLDFLAAQRSRLAPGGRLVMIFPCQDVGSNDVFMLDHLHHFHSRHVSTMGSQLGLVAERVVLGAGFFDRFAMVVFREGDDRPNEMAGLHDPEATRRALATWQRRFSAVDEWLVRSGADGIAVWGLGETFAMMRTYTRLRQARISVAIDDHPERHSALGLVVSTIETVPERMIRGREVLLTFPARPHVLARLEARGARAFSPLDID